MMTRFLSLITALAVLAFAPVAAHAVTETAPATTVPESATSPADPAGPQAATPEAEAPHEAAEDHGGGGLPQLNISTYPSQIFWLLVTFGVLYFAFSKKILPTIGGVVEGRENLIGGNLAEAERFKNEAEAVKAAYEKHLEQARAQAMQAVQEVEHNAKQRAAEQTDAFRRRAENDVNKAEERVSAAKDKAMGDMSSVVAEVAGMAAEKITGVGTDMQNARAIVDSIAGKAKAA
jgi:F-type H+-transporting ATPase subunit b